MPTALITGITGQDGSYLADLLLSKGWEVAGLVRRTSADNRWRVDHLRDRVQWLEGDLLDQGSLIRAVQECAPDHVYNLAAQSFVGVSWREPTHTAEVTGLGALRMLEAVRLVRPEARVYQASSSELFGNCPGPHSADGPFRPRSPYGSAKLFAHATAINYRESYDMFVSCGVLFNHESPRRGREFVTRKVCIAAARAALGDRSPLHLGNLEARRDWGWAPDFVDAMHRMLDADAPSDHVVATGVSHSVRDLASRAYATVGLNYEDFVVVDPKFLRPADVHVLIGDPEPARQALGWSPTVDFDEMVRRMVEAEMHRLSVEPSLISQDGAAR